MSEVYPSDDLNIAWAAGLFEGEGSISFDRGRKARNNRDTGYVLPRLSLSSTDEDVVRRFHAMLRGRGSVNGPRNASGSRSKPHWKLVWVWSVTGAAAVEVIELFSPWLGDRRRTCAREVLDAYNTNVPRAKPRPRCAVEGCMGRTYARSMCRHHYGQWHRAQGGRVAEDLRLTSVRRSIRERIAL